MELLHLEGSGAEAAAVKAAAVLRNGGIVLYPTDTLYGLAVDATNPRAVRSLRELKGRETKKPLSVIVESVEAIERYAVMNQTARDLAARYLPGPLTLVLPAKGTMPAEVQLNGAVGMRVPNDAFSIALAREFGKPYTATSANRSGREAPSSVRETLQQFGPDVNEIALAIDDGPRNPAHASTVVRVTEETPYILREGVIPRAEICG